MDSPWLANMDPASDWTRLAFPEFAAAARARGALAVLPVFGLGDHGLGLPLDIEEVVGAELLRRACAGLRAGGGAPLVLPPLRQGPAPYPAQCFGLDADSGLDWLREVTDGVRRSGFARLALVTTSPWHREWIDAAALDLHAETGLEVFKLHLGDVGMALHPAATMSARAVVQAAGAALLGLTPEPGEAGEVRDAGFRPGYYPRPGAVDAAALPSGFVAEDWLRETGVRCARLLTEAAGIAGEINTAAAGGAARVWRPYGKRYLGAWTERARRSAGDLSGALAIVPVAAIEQHGAHLPVGVDALLGEGLLAGALARLPAEAPVWVTPPITVGRSLEHRGFAGTLSIGSRTLRAMIGAQVRELQALGFGTVALWNSHGGNSAVLTFTVRELQGAAGREGLRVGRLESGFKPELDPHEAAWGMHAGQWETALMLALAPELVTPAAAVREYPVEPDAKGELRPERAAITRAWLTAELCPSGVMGDATAATAEQGAVWLEATTRALAAKIEELIAGR